MSGKVNKTDVEDADFIDAGELASTAGAGDAYKTGVTVVSTTAGNKQVVLSGFDLATERDTPLEAGDKVVLAGNAAAGTYTVNAIINASTFDVVEAIATSTGGTAAFRYPAGATKVGVDALLTSSATTLQDALESFDIGALLVTEPPFPDTDYEIIRSAGQVTQETWKRQDTTLLKLIDYTRTSGLLSQEVRKVYASDGTTITGQLTVIYTRTAGQVVSATYTRDV